MVHRNNNALSCNGIKEQFIKEVSDYFLEFLIFINISFLKNYHKYF